METREYARMDKKTFMVWGLLIFYFIWTIILILIMLNLTKIYIMEIIR